VIPLKESKQEIFVLLLPDGEENVNPSENEKQAFWRALGISP